MLDGLYREVILDHYRHPHGKGLREPYDAEVRHVNPTCGDEVTLRVRLAGDRVADVSYDALGCSISQASASVLTDLVVGQPIGEAERVHAAFLSMLRFRGRSDALPIDEETLGDGVAFAGVAKYPARVKCALLSWMALQDATARATARPSAPSTRPTPRP